MGCTRYLVQVLYCTVPGRHVLYQVPSTWYRFFTVPGRHVRGAGTAAPSRGGSPSCTSRPAPPRCGRCWNRQLCSCIFVQLKITIVKLYITVVQLYSLTLQFTVRKLYICTPQLHSCTVVQYNRKVVHLYSYIYTVLLHSTVVQ